jgi:hypothetical protein
LIDISSSTAGQIKFSSTQNVSADPNTIDAYQEGSVTVPGLTLSFNTSSTGWAFNAAGRYVKIGKFVYLGYSITVTKGSATGSCLLEGLPFTADTTLSGGGAVNNWVSMSTAFAHISADVVASTTTAKLYGSSSGVASLVQLTDTAFQTSSQIIGTLCYRAIA